MHNVQLLNAASHAHDDTNDGHSFNLKSFWNCCECSRATRPPKPKTNRGCDFCENFSFLLLVRRCIGKSSGSCEIKRKDFNCNSMSLNYRKKRADATIYRMTNYLQLFLHSTSCDTRKMANTRCLHSIDNWFRTLFDRAEGLCQQTFSIKRSKNVTNCFHKFQIDLFVNFLLSLAILNHISNWIRVQCQRSDWRVNPSKSIGCAKSIYENSLADSVLVVEASKSDRFWFTIQFAFFYSTSLHLCWVVWYWSRLWKWIFQYDQYVSKKLTALSSLRNSYSTFIEFRRRSNASRALHS